MHTYYSVDSFVLATSLIAQGFPLIEIDINDCSSQRKYIFEHSEEIVNTSKLFDECKDKISTHKFMRAWSYLIACIQKAQYLHDLKKEISLPIRKHEDD